MSTRSRVIAKSSWAVLCALLAVACGKGDDDDSGNGAAGMGAAGMGGSGGMSAGSSGSAAPAATWTQVFDMMYPMATNARCTACHAQPPFDVANGNLSMGMDK